LMQQWHKGIMRNLGQAPCEKLNLGSTRTHKKTD